MKDIRLPDKFYDFEVDENGVLSKNGVSCYPWYNKDGFLSGTARYKLVAEDADINMFCRTSK